jgi:hypothetical protein
MKNMFLIMIALSVCNVGCVDRTKVGSSAANGRQPREAKLRTEFSGMEPTLLPPRRVVGCPRCRIDVPIHNSLFMPKEPKCWSCGYRGAFEDFAQIRSEFVPGEEFTVVEVLRNEPVPRGNIVVHGQMQAIERICAVPLDTIDCEPICPEHSNLMRLLVNDLPVWESFPPELRPWVSVHEDVASELDEGSMTREELSQVRRFSGEGWTRSSGNAYTENTDTPLVYRHKVSNPEPRYSHVMDEYHGNLGVYRLNGVDNILPALALRVSLRIGMQEVDDQPVKIRTDFWLPDRLGTFAWTRVEMELVEHMQSLVIQSVGGLRISEPNPDQRQTIRLSVLGGRNATIDQLRVDRSIEYIIDKNDYRLIREREPDFPLTLGPQRCLLLDDIPYLTYFGDKLSLPKPGKYYGAFDAIVKTTNR